MCLTPEELAYEQLQADIGELAGLITHEFNDVLNAVLLHVAVLEQTVPGSARNDLGEIRKQGRAIAALIKQFQRYRQSHPPEDRAVDLNRLIPEALATFPDSARAQIDIHLEPALPAVLGNAVHFKRLLVFLLRNALAVSPANALVTLRTRRSGGQAEIIVADSGPAVPPGSLAQSFDLYGSPREGANSLELAACKRMVRRFQGDIRCQNGVEGGVAVLVTLKLAA